MNDASSAAISMPFKPTGTYLFKTFGRIFSKFTFAPIAARSGLKNTSPSTVMPAISRNRGASETIAITMFSSAASLGLRVDSTCWMA